MDHFVIENLFPPGERRECFIFFSKWIYLTRKEILIPEMEPYDFRPVPPLFIERLKGKGKWPQGIMKIKRKRSKLMRSTFIL